MDTGYKNSLSLPIRGAGITVELGNGFFSDRDSLTRFRFHLHANFELHYILAGGRLVVGDRYIDARGGDLVIVAPHVQHRIPADSPGTQRFSFSCTLLGQGGEGPAGFIQSRLKDIDGCCVMRDASGELYERLMRIKLEFTERRAFHMDKARAELTALFIELARLMGAEVAASTVGSPVGIDLSVIQRIEAYLEANCVKRESPQKLADTLFVSSRQLDRIIRRMYGKSYRDVLLDKRMEWARYYVEDTDTPLGDIPELLGYASASSFHNAYRQHYGVTPGVSRDGARGG